MFLFLYRWSVIIETCAMSRRSIRFRQCLCGFLVAVTIVLVTNPYLVVDFDDPRPPEMAVRSMDTAPSYFTADPNPNLKTCTTCREYGPKRLVKDVDCQKIIEGDEKYIAKVNKKMESKKFPFKGDGELGNIAENCDVFLKQYDYANFYVSKEELEFPIAFSLLTYKDAVQTEMLLRSIYRPHNVYCLHVDKSANPQIHRAMKNIANCLQNVFIASKLEDVVYAGLSRLQADLNCMSDALILHSVPWKYFINVPHQQYPLKTNSEMVKILRIYNGANDVEGITNPARMFRIRYLKSHHVVNKSVVNTGKAKDPPPHNIKVVKGSAYGVFSRAFVNFTLHDRLAKAVLKWCEDVRSPDEYFWAILNFDPIIKAPGGYSGKLYLYKKVIPPAILIR